MRPPVVKQVDLHRTTLCQLLCSHAISIQPGGSAAVSGAGAVAKGPSMFDTARLDRAGGMGSTNPDPVAELGRCAAAAGLQTASLDEVLCITAV
jgi:hypothetical protein